MALVAKIKNLIMLTWWFYPFSNKNIVYQKNVFGHFPDASQVQFSVCSSYTQAIRNLWNLVRYDFEWV
jgi:hypothetical protein